MTFNLPKWFDLKLYEKTRKYTRRQWAADFQIRREIYQHLLKIREEVKCYAEENAAYNVYQDWEKRTDVRLLKTELYAAALYPNIAQTAGDTSNAIGRLAVDYEALCLYARAIEEMETERTERQEEADRQSKLFRYWLENSISVDFTKTDELIISDFKAWLKEERALRGYGDIKALNNGEIARLYPNRVLPFLDLWLWNEIREPSGKFGNGLFTYNWRKMNALLFPPETLTAKEVASKTAETLRKTTYKQAMRMLKCDVLPF